MLGPNIIGSCTVASEYLLIKNEPVSGALSTKYSKGRRNTNEVDRGGTDIYFDASKANALYVGSAFQPKALRGLAIIKI